MRNCPPTGAVLSIAVLMLCACYSGCDGEVQSVHIVAEDFRFTPDTIHLAGSRPIHLTLFNQGREFHEFESPLSIDPSVVIQSVTLAVQRGRPIIFASHRANVWKFCFEPLPAPIYSIARCGASAWGTLIVERQPQRLLRRMMSWFTDIS